MTRWLNKNIFFLFLQVYENCDDNKDSISTDYQSKHKCCDSEYFHTEILNAHISKKFKCSDVEELINDDFDEDVKIINFFNPPTASICQILSSALCLEFKEVVHFGKYTELTKPKDIHHTRRDGNCFFRSVSYVLTGSEQSHSVFREKLIRHMKNNIKDILRNYLAKDVVYYINNSNMENNGTWATDAEIMSSANLVGMDIIMYVKSGKCFNWLIYPASFTLKKRSEYAIYLTNIDNHFDVILSVV